MYMKCQHSTDVYKNNFTTILTLDKKNIYVTGYIYIYIKLL